MFVEEGTNNSINFHEKNKKFGSQLILPCLFYLENSIQYLASFHAIQCVRANKKKFTFYAACNVKKIT